MTRLPYETSGGSLSPSITFEQLLEYLRKAEEDAQALTKSRKLANDDSTAFMWATIAANFNRCQQVVSHLANSKTRSSTGFRSGKSN